MRRDGMNSARQSPCKADCPVAKETTGSPLFSPDATRWSLLLAEASNQPSRIQGNLPPSLSVEETAPLASERQEAFHHQIQHPLAH